MSAGAGEAMSRVSAQVRQRWLQLDPLLPPPGDPAAGCGATLAVSGPDGQPAAAGTCRHWAGTPGSLDLCWGAARRFQLTPRIAGPDVAGGLDQLLTRWRDHLAGVPGTGAEDTAAVVTWPSRDIDGVVTLLRRGLTPLAVVAARRAGGYDTPRRDDQGVRIRRAGPADLDAVAGLGLEVVRFDAHFGGVIERPGAAEALRHDAATLVAGPQAWTWLAERDGKPVGMLAAERPDAAGWIGPLVGPAPAAYLMLMFVSPGERGSGVGAMLVRQFHREADNAGVAVTLLHYAQLNPLSAPFWSQQGYRPLWTSWEARPARAIS